MASRFFSSNMIISTLSANYRRISFGSQQHCVNTQSHCVGASFDDDSGLPAFVSEELNILKSEILETLIGDSSILSRQVASSDSSSFSHDMEVMAKYYFNIAGKLFRPKVSLLMARACNQLELATSEYDVSLNESVTRNQYKIALISEMIHTASLVHDDVIDKANLRRGRPTVNVLWGNKMAVLVGDYILARATQILCSISDPNVISVMASIIEDLVKGEMMQMSKSDGLNLQKRFEKYMATICAKTASLFANSCKAVAILANVHQDSQSLAYAYGRSLGIAFQLADDLMDFLSSPNTAGKPTDVDLKLGLATAPVLYAAEDYPELVPLISRRFCEESDIARIKEIVGNSCGIEKTRVLARSYAQDAINAISSFPNNDGIRDHLTMLALSQMKRES